LFRELLIILPTSVRNGHLEVPVYFLKSKQGYTVRKIEKHKLNIYYTLLSAGMIKANEVGGTCVTRGRREKSVQGFGGKTRRTDTTWKTKA
jgi:hypothetical protein